MDTVIENERGERIAYAWAGGRAGDPNVVVIGHGVTSDKDRPWSEALSSGLQAAGIASMRIAFSGNGASQGRFEDSNITKEVADLGAIIDALEEHRVSYIGHSMGAAVGVLRAANDGRIRTLVSVGGMVHTRAFTKRMFAGLVPGRDVMIGKPHCPLTQQYLDDLNAIGSVESAAAAVRVPWLLVHGTADDVIPVQDARDVQQAAGGRPELVVVDGADHSFTGEWTEKLADIVVPWLVRRLGRA